MTTLSWERGIYIGIFRGVSRGVQLCHPVVGYSSTLTRERNHTAKILLQCVSSSPVAKPGVAATSGLTMIQMVDIWTDHDLTVRPMNKTNLPPSFLHPVDHPDKVSLRSDKPFVSYRDQCHEVSENVTTLKTYFAQTSTRHQSLLILSSLPLYKLSNEPWMSGWRSELDEKRPTCRQKQVSKSNVKRDFTSSWPIYSKQIKAFPWCT